MYCEANTERRRNASDVYWLQVGFNKADGMLAYQNPWSLSPGVKYINAQNNVGDRGRWMYRVDGSPGIPSTCVLPSETSKFTRA